MNRSTKTPPKPSDKITYKGATIRKTVNGTFQADFQIDKKRRRKKFKTEEDAKSWLKAELKERDDDGNLAFILSPEEKLNASGALELLREHGQGVSLRTAVEFYIKHHPVNDSKLTLEQALSLYEADMRNPKDGGDPARPASINNKRKRLKGFLELHGGKDVRSITDKDVEAWAEGFSHLAMKTQINRKAELQSVLNFVEREELVPAFENTVCKIKQRKKKGGGKAEILSPEVAKAMLHKLEEDYPSRYAVTFALMCFAGIRPQELIPEEGKGNPLTWENIRLDEGKIHVQPETDKTGDYREIPISDNLREWLVRYQGEGRIAPSSSRFRKARTKARIHAKLESWPSDGARHSYATYGGEIHGLHMVAGWMGHVGGLAMLKRHYQGRTTAEQAEEFFGILPAPKEQGKVIQMSVAS